MTEWWRSEITHNYAYHFKKTQRSLQHKSGLDYTKIVILNKTEYLDNKDAIIDKDEFNEMIVHLEKIKNRHLNLLKIILNILKEINYCICLNLKEGINFYY